MARYMLYVDVDIDEFVAEVQKDLAVSREACLEALDEALNVGRDYARATVDKDTWALYKSIRKFSYKPPIGYLAVRGFSAGGYEVNPKTGRLVDYAQVVDEGYGPHGREPTWFFTGATIEAEEALDEKMQDAMRRVARIT